MLVIYLAPFLNSEKINFESLQIKIYKNLLMESRIIELALDSRTAYDPERNQYNSSILLHRLLEELPDKSSKIFGITQIDLYIPILTFVFGVAQLRGCAGVVSTYRLRNQLYGLPANEALLEERLGKVVVHELGHIFGLYHCSDYQCVMKSSTYVEELDIKGDTFCSSCKRAVS